MRFLRPVFLILAAVGAVGPAHAQSAQPSLTDSFRLGSGTGLLCRMQSRLTDPSFATMFDRAYAIVCRDAAAPVGNIYVLRADEGDPERRLADARASRVTCETQERSGIEDLGPVDTMRCRLTSDPVAYTVYTWRSGENMYVAEGLAGYDSALRLGLRSIVADQILPGQLSIATTELGDATAFARVQAGTLDVDQALAEAYRRNNSGDYAESAEFFSSLLRRSDNSGDANERAAEYLINEALQLSNLGQFEAAEDTYARALAIPSASPTQLRLRRNFRTLHLLNQRRFDDALSVLNEPLATSMTPLSSDGSASINQDTATAINSGSEFARRIGGEASERLTVTERVVILDAQAKQLRGSILRIEGDLAGAATAQNEALEELASVRDGRVRSTARMRAQALGELAVIAEEQGDVGEAEQRLRDAIALMEVQYPFAIATSAYRARLAAFLARQDRNDEALATYRAVIEENREKATARIGLEYQLAPYLDLLLAEIPANPSLTDDFFLATETLVRPGVANTQAVLARELSEGNDEAARLFRQSVTLSRDVESAQVELSRLRMDRNLDAPAEQRITTLGNEITQLAEAQTITQARLSQYPRYQAVSTSALHLETLQAGLLEGEAYLKLSAVAGRLYAVLVTPSDAIAYQPIIDADTLDERVNALRDTISVVEDGRQLTYPFAVGLAYELYGELIGPVADRLVGIDHLIFEPDGAMLRLPLNLLVTDEAAVLTYEARLDTPGNDDFDFTDIAWLGREMDVSTAVSARNFLQVRALPASAANRAFLGFGQNAAPPARFQRASYSTALPSGSRCQWPLSVWRRPISDHELRTARNMIGGLGSEIVTGEAFTDEHILAQTDLDDFRVVHFATHGLVTQSSPECPPMPSLVTSFGDSDSDGLLSFGEIFDLRLDADLVILSACDTASAAGATASQAAGLRGGDSALDGLVRAFVGAGSRAVIASHWPAPDDYSATERLITGFFEAGSHADMGGAMRQAQRALMDDPETSHPYYWAGFAIIGDGARSISADSQ